MVSDWDMEVTCHRDGAFMLEDLSFRADMRSYGCPQRRFFCPMGHARITDVPSGVFPERVVRPPGFPLRRCGVCGKTFESRWKAEYCSDACRAERARDRERQARAAGRTLRQKRASAKVPRRSWGAILALHPSGAPKRHIPQVSMARGTGGWA